MVRGDGAQLSDEALDRGWKALCDWEGPHDLDSPVHWIEGAIYRSDEPDDRTRAVIRAIADAVDEWRK